MSSVKRKEETVTEREGGEATSGGPIPQGVEGSLWNS